MQDLNVGNREVFEWKSPLMKVVLKFIQLQCVWWTTGREVKLVSYLDPLLSLTPCDSSPDILTFMDTRLWFLLFSNLLFSVRNFYSPHLWPKSALHPHIFTSLGKVHLLIRFWFYMYQNNSKSTVPKISTECGKEIPQPQLYSWRKAARVRNWKGMLRWQNCDHFGSILLNRRRCEVGQQPGGDYCYLS